MAVNKYMHPRNIYKQPPDFAKLARENKEFAKIAKLDLGGKVRIDFKDLTSLRTLTKCLLKADFDLEVHIPEDRLVPTLPLRLNYILWLEDLMAAIKRENLQDSPILGIDIGTGACAVYPLLAARKNKWHMIGTDTDDVSLQVARDNINNNNLQDLVKVIRNTSETVIKHCFDEDPGLKADFCMCNPPFYSSLQELCESRSSARPPPKNCFTGTPQELITEGGELDFIQKLINESKLLQDKISIYTTMVGHKYIMKELLNVLEGEGIRHTHTEFCQGRTTRWGLAWTFNVAWNLLELVPPRVETRKKNLPIAFILSPLQNVPYSISAITKQLTSILNKLSITCRIVTKKAQTVTFEIKAKVNTWSNQRRKRRLERRLHEDNYKRAKTEDTEFKISETKNLIENEVDQVNGTCYTNGNIKDTIIDDGTYEKPTKTYENCLKANIPNIESNKLNTESFNVSDNCVKEDELKRENNNIINAKTFQSNDLSLVVPITKPIGELDVGLKENAEINKHTNVVTHNDKVKSKEIGDHIKNMSNNLTSNESSATNNSNNPETNEVLSNMEAKETTRTLTTKEQIGNNVTFENRNPQTNKIIKQINTKETTETNTNLSDISDTSDILEATTSSSELMKDFVLHSLLIVGKRESDIIMQMEFLNGSGGKDAMHQVIQFIKNNWK